MGIIITIGTIIFFILAVLLVTLILLQSDKSAGMGILGGSSQSTFGSSTADIITKITGVMVAIFMVGSLGLAILESYRTKQIDKEFESTPKAEVIQTDTKTAEEAKSVPETGNQK